MHASNRRYAASYSSRETFPSDIAARVADEEADKADELMSDCGRALDVGVTAEHPETTEIDMRAATNAAALTGENSIMS
jgi:hypothetical protein